MTDVKYRPMMSSSDAIIWNIEKDPQLQSTIMAVWLLDEEPTPERMAQNVDRMVAAIPRLRQRVQPGRPRPSWDPLDAGELDLAHHYVAQSMAPGSDFSAVLDFAQTWVREPFDRTRPLWRLALLTGLAGGKAAIVIKVHHAIADGMGMVLMLGAFTDFERHPVAMPIGDSVVELPPGRDVYSPAKRLATRIGRAARSFGRSPLAAFSSSARTLGSAIRLVTPHRAPHSRLMTERSQELVMTTRRIDLAAFRALAAESGCSLNDLFVSLIADAITIHHQRLGVDCPRLRVHMPVDIRTDRTATLAGNQFVPARVSLDLDARPPGPARRLDIMRQLETLRSEPALAHINTVSAAIQKLGKPISRWIIGGMMKGVDVLASNVPGPDFPLFIAGTKIEEFYAFGPPAGAALNATLFSYDGDIGIGLTIDDSAIVDRAAFLRSLDDTLALNFASEVELATAS